MKAKKTFTGEIYRDWMGGIQRRKLADILQRVEAKPRVLDVGSGPGFLGVSLEGIYCVDVDLVNLKHSRGGRVLASGDWLPFKDESFQTVFCLDTIHLLQGSGEISRSLRRGGKAVISAFCNEYNKDEKLNWLKRIFKNWRIEKEFFVGKEEGEMDAVITCVKEGR